MVHFGDAFHLEWATMNVGPLTTPSTVALNGGFLRDIDPSSVTESSSGKPPRIRSTS